MAYKSSKVDAAPGTASSGQGNWFIFGWLLGLAQLLLHGSLGLVLFWVLYYRGGFGWRDEPKLEFNYHPVLMIGGFVYLAGNALLSYRSYGCCRQIYKKLFHTVFHILAVPAIVMGFLTVLDSHNLANPPIANFYSLHSWMGLTTMGLFAIQLVVGFFSFLILLCCEARTQAFRAALVPVHATFGLVTFLMAVATALTGLTEKAIFSLGATYKDLLDEAVVVNTLGATLLALMVVMPVLLLLDKFRARPVQVIAVHGLMSYEAFVPEGIVLNALGACLIGLIILMPVIVLLRCRVRCGGSALSTASSDEESERL